MPRSRNNSIIRNAIGFREFFMKKSLLFATVVACGLTSIFSCSTSVYASEDNFGGAVTESEMKAEVAMYDEETGEFFFVKDQETADYCTENYGWSQVTKESVDTGVPDYIKQASSDSSNGEEKAVKSSTSSGTSISDENVNVQAGAVSDDGDETDQKIKEGDTNNTAVTETTEDQESDAVSHAATVHGPYAEFNDDAKNALAGLLKDDEIDEDERYIEIYGTADSILISADDWNSICEIGKGFSIRVVGAKENILYQYNFSESSLNSSDSGIELKLTAVEEDDVNTYMSFHKTQDLPGDIEFMFPVTARTNYELRDSDSNVICKGISDDEGKLSLTLNTTGNYELVDIDRESVASETSESEVSQDKPFSWKYCAAGISGIAAIIIALIIFKRRRG